MKIEGMEIALFRGIFGNLFYEQMRSVDFVLSFVEEELANSKQVTAGYTSYKPAEEGKSPTIIVAINLFALDAYQEYRGFKGLYGMHKVLKGVVLHEFMHVNQILSGDLSKKDGKVYWKGKAYPDPKNGWEYMQLPWEKEAFMVEYGVGYGLAPIEVEKLYNKEVYKLRPFSVRCKDFFTKLFKG